MARANSPYYFRQSLDLNHSNENDPVTWINLHDEAYKKPTPIFGFENSPKKHQGSLVLQKMNTDKNLPRGPSIFVNQSAKTRAKHLGVPGDDPTPHLPSLTWK